MQGNSTLPRRALHLNGADCASEPFPFLAINPALAKNAHQQTPADVLRMGIRDAELSTPASHVLVIAAGYWRLETQGAQEPDQIPPFDWADGWHSGGFLDLNPGAADIRDRRVIGDAEKQPSFEHALQFFAAGFKRLGVGPDAGDRRYFTVERAVILDDFVPRLAHGGTDVRCQHNPIIALRRGDYDAIAGYSGRGRLLAWRFDDFVLQHQ